MGMPDQLSFGDEGFEFNASTSLCVGDAMDGPEGLTQSLERFCISLSGCEVVYGVAIGLSFNCKMPLAREE
jgi:hypothetical protein